VQRHPIEELQGQQAERLVHRDLVRLHRRRRFAIGPVSIAPVGIGAPMEHARMKPDIHPDYHEINIVMTDGTTFKTRSTMGKAGDTLRLDIDPKVHPAWTGQQRQVSSGGQVAKFNKRFAGIGLKKG
jgi:large subunit ribosomal protein L31